MTPAALRRWMKRRGLTQKQAAALLASTQQAVSYWTRGKRPIPADVAKIIELLDRIEELERGTDPNREE